MVEQLLSNYGILAIACLMFLNGLFSFPPSELVIGFSGALLLDVEISSALIFFIIVISNYLGTLLLYIIARFWGYQFFKVFFDNRIIRNIPILRKIIPEYSFVKRLLSWFRQDGVILIFVLRFFPLLRSVISIPAGITKVNFFFFSVLTLLGISIWTVFWLFMGRILGTNIDNGRHVAFFVMIALLAIILLFLKRKIQEKLK